MSRRSRLLAGIALVLAALIALYPSGGVLARPVSTQGLYGSGIGSQ